MIDEQNVLIESDSKRWPPVEVTIPDASNPFVLVLFFEHLGVTPPFLGFTVVSNDDELDPASFARLARILPMYVDYGRARIELKYGDRVTAVEALRAEAGKSRRGLPERFYQEIATEYLDLVAANDPHPIKTMADARPVHKSRASRWVKEARHRGYLNEGKQ